MLSRKYFLPVLITSSLILSACQVGEVQLTKPVVTCAVNGEEYRAGEPIPQADGCNTCICGANGEVDACTEIACPEPATGLANPAAVQCSVDGYRYEIREDADGGEYGVCIDEADTECDGWQYFHGECLLGDTTQTFSAELKDVTGGEASGEANSEFSAEKYTHSVVAKYLPALEDGYFYEGWLVQLEPLDVISTGKMIPDPSTDSIGSPQASSGQEGNFALSLETQDDLTSYTRVVITLEPDDGDPEPAEHVLEGTLERL